MEKLTDAVVYRLWELIDQFSFEWSGVADEHPEDETIQDINEKAEYIYSKLDEEKCKRAKR
jgi:hypothetical protein